MSHSVLMDGGRPGIRSSVVVCVVVCNCVCKLGKGQTAISRGSSSRGASQSPCDDALTLGGESE